MKNFTSTIVIPHSHVPYVSPESGWNATHYNAHYNEHVKPIFDEIRTKVNLIEDSQSLADIFGTQSILWNKCRYFEMSVYNKDILRFVSQSAKVKVKYNNMLVGGKDKLEAVVKAFNKKGIRCRINQDWV